jgi:hypothetical protein
VAVLLAGCTYSDQEPGLFPQPPPAETTPPAPLGPTNPLLPVLGERIWTTGEGLHVTTRFAVHAVRRVERATILDWSVTPLSAPGLRTGDLLPSWVDFGLTREAGGHANILLVDRAGGHVYRPLSDSQEGVPNCLCSPLWVAQMAIRLGETRLLQVSYPELPAALEFVDVAPANVVPFFHVPVSPRGHVPVTGRSVDLSRPAEGHPADRGSVTFPNRYAGRNRLQRITINAVVAAPTSTTLVWTLASVTDQPFSVLAPGPPIVARLPDELGVVHRASASGPRLRIGKRDLSVSWLTTQVQRGAYYECLCTGIGLWASSLRRGGNSVQVITSYGPMPTGTNSVTVVLTEAGVLPSVPVEPAQDSAVGVQHQASGDDDTWVFTPYRPPQGWSSDQWPTPTPDPDQVRFIAPVVEDLVSLPGVR